jgi:hypothetical protein
MVLLALRGPDEVLILYTHTSWGSWSTRQNHVDNWKATLNMSFSDAICWLHFSLVNKEKANNKKMNDFSFFPPTSLMQFRDCNIATLWIENNSKFLSSFLERGQEAMRILTLTAVWVIFAALEKSLLKLMIVSCSWYFGRVYIVWKQWSSCNALIFEKNRIL